MAEKHEDRGYVGRVPNAGAAVVKAPNQVSKKKSVTAHRGDDLRSSKK